MKKLFRFRKPCSDLAADQSGLALVEFAVSLPFFMILTVGGFETSNYAYTVMKINQLTINAADGAARIGQGDPLTAKRVTESDINDVFAGTIREGQSILLGGQHQYKDPGTGTVTLRGNARIILSSVEPVASFDAANPRYRIRWQRCVGQAGFYQSNYGDSSTATSITGIGPTGRKISPPDDGAIMFVETQYYFKPLIVNGFSKLTERTIAQTSAMVVRERRDYVGGTDGVYPVTGVTPSLCAAAT